MKWADVLHDVMQLPTSAAAAHVHSIPSGTLGVTVQSGVPATSGNVHRGPHVSLPQVG